MRVKRAQGGGPLKLRFATEDVLVRPALDADSRELDFATDDENVALEARVVVAAALLLPGLAGLRRVGRFAGRGVGIHRPDLTCQSAVVPSLRSRASRWARTSGSLVRSASTLRTALITVV